jgi:hypothetical protein
MQDKTKMKTKKHYDKFIRENSVSPHETLSWEQLRSDFNDRETNSNNYSIQNGEVCYQSRPVIGWNSYYDKLVEIVQSFTNPPSTKQVQDRAEEKFCIQPKAVTKFCELCTPNDNNSNELSTFHNNNNNNNNNNNANANANTTAQLNGAAQVNIMVNLF